MNPHVVFFFACLAFLMLFLGPHASFVAQPSTRAGTAFDLDDLPEARIPLAPFLTFGGEVELEHEFESNFDLDETVGEDRAVLTPKLLLALLFDPGPHFQASLNLELSRQFSLVGSQEKERLQLEVREAVLRFKKLWGERFSVQVGRQRFNDQREWLYDEELDAIKLSYRVSRLSLALSVSRENLVDRDLLNSQHQERINNYLLYGRYKVSKAVRIAAYGLVRDDQSRRRESPIFLGVRSDGAIIDEFAHWFDLAQVRGKDGSQKIRGFGVDGGFTRVFAVRWTPSLTFGYAFGSGDNDPDDRTDGSFRQTGLQDNEAAFNGVTRFKYYGELFDPELSNLSIFTSGIGIRPLKRGSIDLVYHYYRQHKRVTGLRNVGIDAAPTERNREIGSEVDLILGYRELWDIDLKLALGYFVPGQAYSSRVDDSFFTNVEVEFDF